MWKYILIIAFVIFAVREINLMNESLYIAPDTHKIVAEDRTVIGRVEKVIEEKIGTLHRKSRQAHAVAQKENQTASQEMNNSRPAEAAAAHPAEQITKAPEKERSKPLPGSVHTSTPEPHATAPQPEQKSATKSPAPKAAAPLPTPLRKIEQVIEQKTGKPVVLKQSKPVKQPRTQPAASPYKSAEERVRAILEEMKQSKH